METSAMPVRILFVDDERNVLRSLERVFLDDDYEVVTAGSAEEGLQIMEESGDSFQVVVSDYRMPVVNGVDFLKQVYEKWPDTVRIVLSGYADAGAIVAAINEGHIYKFIPKPWNDEELRVTIHNSLERYSLLKENRELLAELAETNHDLEAKVQQRMEELELRNRALEFAQTMLGELPVGVVGIDESGLIVHCNSVAAALLMQLCKDFFGIKIEHFSDPQFRELVRHVREVKYLETVESFAGRNWKVLGKTVRFSDSESVVLVFLEVTE